MSDRLTIVEQLLGRRLEDGQFAPCPGLAQHSKGSGRRDFRVVLDGAPTGFCFHSSCSGAVEEFNKELRRRIWFAEHGDRPPPSAWNDGVAPEPRTNYQKRPPIDQSQLANVAADAPEGVDIAWLTRRSPVDPAGVTSAQFLDALFAPDERVLVFTTQYSQGDFCHWIGHGSYRLSQERGTKAEPSQLPGQARDGVWYLVQPVSGKWEINAKLAGAKYTRRSEINVTSWRHFVIESDEVPAETWLRVLVQLPLPIAAVYTSGGRSIHALVRYPVESKGSWDATQKVIVQLVCPLGADPASLTAVRLSRLPGARRGDREQRLLYLNPDPDTTALMLMPERRAE